MRMIGAVSTEPQAQRLSAYLLTVNIESHVEESPTGQWQVWIEHDDDLDKGKSELEQFLAHPNDARYASAGAAATKLRKEKDKAAERRRKNFKDVRTHWSGASRYGTPAAMFLVLACVLIMMIANTTDKGDAIYSALLFDATSGPLLRVTDAGQPVYGGSMFDDIGRGQVWRLVTPMLLHGGMLHLIFNMMWLWRLGQVIEGIKGTLFFIILILLISALSCTAQALWYEGLTGWNAFLGMSGVNAGLLGYAWMKRRYQPYERIHVADQEIGMMVGWLVICSTGIVGPIANAAHWGGLIVGMAIGVLPTVWRKLRSR